ncbi:MAG: HAMP domain-containing sensor histidine kinase [Spirulinaceae cyanobacterium]
MQEISWVYLLVGLGLGIVGTRLTSKSKLAKAPTDWEVPEQDPVTPQLTEQIENLQQQLQQTQLAYQMAAQMSSFKAGFLARTSHELRSPLNSLIGLHQLILSELCDSPEEEREFIEQAHQSALKLIKLIDEIIQVSKVEHGTNRLEIRPVGLSIILNSLSGLNHLQAANSNIRLGVIIPESEVYVLADSQYLLQILTLLVDTSIAFMDSGSISVFVSPDQSEFVEILLEIDSEERIWYEPVNLLEQIPEPSIEVARSSYQEPATTPGMKLLMAQTLLELMGGKLNITATPQQEEPNSKLTQLQCLLPLASAEAVNLELKEM